MQSASTSLQRAVFGALTIHSRLVALLGGAKIYDGVPQETRYPFVTFGSTQERDWSTGSEAGAEHILHLHVWSEVGSRKLAQEILAEIRDALHDKPLALDGHRLVGIRHETSETRRTTGAEVLHGTARFRAVTEPL